MDDDLRDTHILGRKTYQRLVSAANQAALATEGLAECGLSLSDEGFAVVQSRPAAAVLVLILDGAGELLVDGGWQPAAGGTVYLAPAVMRRGWRGRQRDWHIAWLAWEPSSSPAAIPTIPTRLPVDGSALADVVRLLWRETIAHLMPLLRLQLGRILGADPGHRLDRLWLEVDADPAHAWNIATLAARIGVGPERLRRLCRTAHGEAPMERVRRLRLARAAALLAATSMPVRAVAEAVGYADPEAFATAFRRQHGHSPRRG